MNKLSDQPFLSFCGKQLENLLSLSRALALVEIQNLSLLRLASLNQMVQTPFNRNVF